MAAKSYQQLSIHEKRALDLSRVREPAVTCRYCDMQIMPIDLVAHQKERCSGPREPGPSARWMNWREAVALIRRAATRLSEGAAMMRLSRWSSPDHRGEVAVRARGTRGERKYLHADLAKQLDREGLVVGTNKIVSEEP